MHLYIDASDEDNSDGKYGKIDDEVSLYHRPEKICREVAASVSSRGRELCHTGEGCSDAMTAVKASIC